MRRIFHLQHSLPSSEAVMGRLGYNSKKNEDTQWNSFIEKAIVEFSPLLEAKGVLKTVKVISRTEASIELEEGLLCISTKLANVLSKSEEVSVLAATLGEKIMEKIQHLLTEGEVTKAAILDAIASEAIEHFVDWMQAVIAREKLRFSLGPTMRFSPGYGDWKLDIQPRLLSFLGASEIGLFSHPVSHVLIPEKSITAIVGWMKQ